MPSTFCIAFGLALILPVLPAMGQSSAELNQHLGTCNAQTDRQKRGQCFEQLAKKAVSAFDAKTGADKDPVTEYAGFVGSAKANITSDLKDPSSVQWRGLFVSYVQDTAPSHLILCGEMNAKNAMGGYTGFRRFFSGTGPDIKAIDTETKPNVLAAMWGSACAQNLARIPD